MLPTFSNFIENYTNIYNDKKNLFIKKNIVNRNMCIKKLNKDTKIFLNKFKVIYPKHIQQKQFLRVLVEKKLINGTLLWNNSSKIQLSTFFDIDNMDNLINNFIEKLIYYYRSCIPNELVFLSRNRDIPILVDIIDLIFTNQENILFKTLISHNWRDVGFECSITKSIILLFKFKSILINLNENIDGYTYEKIVSNIFKFQYNKENRKILRLIEINSIM